MNSDNEIHAVEITRTREDYIALCKYAPRTNNVAIYFLVSLVVVTLMSLGLLDLVLRHNFWGLLAKREGAITALAVMVIIIFVAIKILNKVLTPRMFHDHVNENQNFLRKQQVTIDEKCLRETSDVGEAFTLWRGVDRIERNKEFFLVYIDRMQAYIIPIRNFSTPEQANQFYENMLAYWHKAHGRAVPVRPQ